mmetsp:Transcript_3504/g.4677  ORF Transcript_3504/g.4677 Transcript_3504/m.4677 type:complete len:93 (-) Transcript_3504:258-536(-)
MKTSSMENCNQDTTLMPSLSTLMLRSRHRHENQPDRRTPEERRKQLERTLQAAIQLVDTFEDHHPLKGTATATTSLGKENGGNLPTQGSPKQ